MDEGAFSSYVAARRARLFRTACLLCGDPHRAGDIVQDALARLHGVWDRVSRMDSIDGYVRRIIHRPPATAISASRSTPDAVGRRSFDR